jgi:hypothetical protein
MVRDVVNCGFRAGLYRPVRDSLAQSKDDCSLKTRLAAAIATGAIGSIVSNLFDVVKVRLLADEAAYPSTFGAYGAVLRDEGLGGALRGIVPSTLRGSTIACGEIACYDQAKVFLRGSFGIAEEGPATHIAASLIAGLAATTLAAPFDMVKTRTMASESEGPWSVTASIVRQEGLRSLMRGWLPAYLRLGPHAILCMPLMEQCRAFMGVDYL